MVLMAGQSIVKTGCVCQCFGMLFCDIASQNGLCGSPIAQRPAAITS